MIKLTNLFCLAICMLAMNACGGNRSEKVSMLPFAENFGKVRNAVMVRLKDMVFTKSPEMI